MARLIGEKALNTVVSHMPGVRGALLDQAKKTEKIADTRLQQARASTPWFKILDPDGQTKIGIDSGEVDYFVYMEAYKMGAMALEFGHAPSGVFGPGGMLGHIKTKAPLGLYIMTGAYIQS